MQKSSNGMTFGIAILLLSILPACSEHQAPRGGSEVETITLSGDAEQAEQRGAKKDMPALRYENVILILGGSPSLMPKGEVEKTYSQKLQQRVGSRYKVLNASVADEAAGPREERLPYLFTHDIKAIVLEMGQDEYQSGLAPKAFRKKLESILQQESLSTLPLYLLLSAPNQKYQHAIKDLSGSYDLALIIPGSPLSDAQAWHESAASQLEHYLEIVR